MHLLLNKLISLSLSLTPCPYDLTRNLFFKCDINGTQPRDVAMVCCPECMHWPIMKRFFLQI